MKNIFLLSTIFLLDFGTVPEQILNIYEQLHMGIYSMESLEDYKGITKVCKWKDRQYNTQSYKCLVAI
jgi:hypothetical protein